VSGRNDRLGSPVDVWVRQWWPWLVLAVGATVIAIGGYLFSRGLDADGRFGDVAGTPTPVIVATATS
jgi:hypothetical protein